MASLDPVGLADFTPSSGLSRLPELALPFLAGQAALPKPDKVGLADSSV
jgi:hypothetical protein